MRLAGREGAGLHERRERDDLGPDEVLLEVRVDRGRGLHGVRPLRDRPGAALVLARRQEGHEAEEVVGGAKEPVERPVREAEALEELGLVLGRHRGDLLLDRRRDGAEGDVRLALPRVELRAGESARKVGRVGLARVEDHEHRLSRQEAEALDELRLLRVDVEAAEGLALFEGRLEAHEEVLLGRELGRLLLREVPLDALEAVRDDGKVREEHLGLEELEVARRVDRALGVRDRVRREAAHDDREAVHLAQLGEVEALGASLHDPRDVHERHGRGRVLLGLEHRREAVEARVGDVGDPEMRLALVRRGGRRVARQEREDRRLSGELEAEDAEFHGRILLHLQVVAVPAGVLDSASPGARRPHQGTGAAFV